MPPLAKAIYYLAAIVMLTTLPWAVGTESPDLRMQLLYVSSACACICGVCVALSIGWHRKSAKDCEIERLNARIMLRGRLLSLNPDATPSRIFRAGYRSALMEHAPHKLAEFDADWPTDMKEHAR